MAFDHFCLAVSLLIPDARASSVWIGVSFCAWPVSATLQAICGGVASLPLQERAPLLASMAEDVSAFMMAQRARGSIHWWWFSVGVGRCFGGWLVDAEERVRGSSRASFGNRQVGGVTVDMEMHFACNASRGGIWVRCAMVE